MKNKHKTIFGVTRNDSLMFLAKLLI